MMFLVALGLWCAVGALWWVAGTERVVVLRGGWQPAEKREEQRPTPALDQVCNRFGAGRS